MNIAVLLYLLPPIWGCVIGYITNDIAIRMLFRPHKAISVWGFHIPFTPGIIPKEKERISKAIGEAISDNLMNKEVLERTLLSEDMISKIADAIDVFCNRQKNNNETVQAFASHYLSEDELSSLVSNTTDELKSLLSAKLAKSNFGHDIAHMAVEHAVGKVSEGLIGVLGANIIINPIKAIAEPLLEKEINSMVQKNSATIIQKMIQDQRSDL